MVLTAKDCILPLVFNGWTIKQEQSHYGDRCSVVPPSGQRLHPLFADIHYRSASLASPVRRTRNPLASRE